MKKHLLLLVIFTSFMICCKAQKNAMEYGFQAGVNINTASGTGISKELLKSLTGLHAAGHFKIQTSPHFGFKIMVAYDQSGWIASPLTFSSNNGNGLETGKLVQKLNYLNVPLLAEYNFGKKIKFTFNGGIFAGFVLENRMIKKIKDPGTYSQNIGPGQRRSGNFGFSAGAGIKIPVAKKIKLDFGINDNLGIANIYKPAGSSDNATIKLNMLSFVTGFSFQLR